MHKATPPKDDRKLDAPGADGPKVRQLDIGPDRAGQRVDNYLMTRLKGVPRSAIYRLLRTGQVRVNGGRSKPDRRLQDGDVLRIPPVRMASRESIAPAAGQLRQILDAIIFEDEHFLVLNKPSGVASHGGSGIQHGAIELLRAARPGEPLELVHRLDRDTSGVLVLARTRRALTGLQTLIREGQPVKQYLALLDGAVAKARFDINVPLRKFVLSGGERMVRVASDGKPALTFFKSLQAFPDATLVEVTLATGRTHQIRVHAAYAGHAIAGDGKYASRQACKHFLDSGLKRLFLHASRFGFDWGSRAYDFSTPLPGDLKAVLDRLQSGDA